MRNADRLRMGAALLLMAVAATVSAWALFPSSDVRGSETAEALPYRLGDWVGKSIHVDEETKRILETDDVIQRDYVRAGSDQRPFQGEVPVQFAVVFSPANRRAVHPPEICYAGAGWETVDKHEIRPEGLPPLMRVVMNNGGLKTIILYCYRTGDSFTASYLDQQLSSARQQLLMRPSPSALIRFSCPVLTGDEKGIERQMLGFARLMMPEIEKTLR